MLACQDAVMESEAFCGGYRKNEKLRVWVTADKRHIPVKIKSKVKVGSFVGELISVGNRITDKKNLKRK
jgi:hypothetical protein